MKKRSKVLSILLATAMAGSMLAGCGGSSDSGESTSEQSSESKEEAKEEKTTEASPNASKELAYKGELSMMHYSTSEESEGNGGSDGFSYHDCPVGRGAPGH